MNAFAIKRIPNVEHTRRVLGTRHALRLVPTYEGVWASDRDGSGEAGETALAGSTVGDSAGLQGIAEPHGDSNG